MDSAIYKIYADNTLSNTCMYFVNPNFLVTCDTTYLRVFSINSDKTKATQLAQYNVTGLAGFGSSSPSRTKISIYSESTQDINIIIPGHTDKHDYGNTNGGYINYLKFNANTNTITYIGNVHPVSPMYSTQISVYFPHHRNDHVMLVTPQVVYDRIDKQVIILYSLTSTAITQKTVLYNQKLYGNPTENVHWANNDHLFYCNKNTQVDVSSSRRPYMFIFDDNMNFVRSTTGTYDNNYLRISDEGNYGTMNSRIYNITYDSNNYPVLGSQITTTPYSITELYQNKMLYSRVGSTTRIYKLKDDNTLELRYTTSQAFSIGPDFNSSNYYSSSGICYIIPNITQIGLQLKYDSYYIKNRNYHDTSIADATPANVTAGKIFASSNDMLVGTMPDNGELNYTPLETAQTIPAGYTSGGIISAVNITTLNEYQECLNLTQEILL